MPRTSTRAKARAEPDVAESSYRLDNQVGFQLRRAYQRATANLIARIGPLDLTPPQFATLARLHERGPISQNLLGRLVGMESANIRDVVQRLRKRGLIQLERDVGDKRLVLLSLSSRGRELFERLRPLSILSTADTLAPLRPMERQLLLDLLSRIADGPALEAKDAV